MTDQLTTYDKNTDPNILNILTFGFYSKDFTFLSTPKCNAGSDLLLFCNQLLYRALQIRKFIPNIFKVINQLAYPISLLAEGAMKDNIFGY